MQKKEEILNKIKDNYRFLSFVRNQDLLNDKNFMLEVLKSNPDCYLSGNFKFKNDIEVLKFLINEKGKVFYNGFFKVPDFDDKILETNQEYKELYNTYQNLRKKNNYCRLFYNLIGVSGYEYSKISDNINLNLVTDNFILKFNSLISLLNEREQNILFLRYGLDGTKIETPEQVGKMFDVTRERIIQIERKALRHLKVYLKTTELGSNVINEAIKIGLCENLSIKDITNLTKEETLTLHHMEYKKTKKM